MSALAEVAFCKVPLKLPAGFNDPGGGVIAFPVSLPSVRVVAVCTAKLGGNFTDADI